MKAIDLLGERHRLAAATRWKAILTVALCASLAVFLYHWTSSALAPRRQELATLQSEYAQLRIGPERLAYLQSRQRLLAEQKAALAGLLAPAQPSKLIDAVLDLCPRDVEITEISITPSELLLKGRSPNLGAIRLLLERLAGSPDLLEVTLKAVTSETAGQLLLEVSALRPEAGR